MSPRVCSRSTWANPKRLRHRAARLEHRAKANRTLLDLEVFLPLLLKMWHHLREPSPREEM